VPTATSQSMDPFKSSLEERKDTIMLAGGRRNLHSKRERCKSHYTVQNNITAECGRQDFLLCTCQETDKVYDRQQLCRHICTEGRNFRLFWLCRAYNCTFPTDQRGQVPQCRLDLGLVGFSQCIRLYYPPVN